MVQIQIGLIGIAEAATHDIGRQIHGPQAPSGGIDFGNPTVDQQSGDQARLPLAVRGVHEGRDLARRLAASATHGMSLAGEIDLRSVGTIICATTDT